MHDFYVSELATADWFGLITGVFVAGEFDVHVRRNNSERVFYIGGKSNTILFKYEICKMDKNGAVYETVSFRRSNRVASIEYDETYFPFRFSRSRKWSANGCP